MKKKLTSGRFWCTLNETSCRYEKGETVCCEICDLHGDSDFCERKDCPIFDGVCKFKIPLEQKPIRIYISGQITGDPNAREKFAKYARLFRRMGFEVVDPFYVNPNGGKWAYCMIEDLREMYKCDAVFMIGIWFRSRGACKERNKALAFGIPVIYDDVNNKKNVYRALKNIKPYRSMY